ncbi:MULTISPECIES: AimR family lysis-lysogeny pheromone receptor [Pontibacillus]|uniref:AimR family lysis-lysogeny pheromone receptor n=1 Tax=Pontibacillus chungwhensis TaxID=265426 RepID=A0ABY8UXJ1_9BACI|nr:MULTISPECIES: AimR family lysis-lysogeny pheromone receptor [Pontibacillus]MCD5324020.1 AimR family lysis-lysogeny pheromone receptor [Pontibacillus sp. HN14]WIF97918.1 AimR family lysis-lysogeny pheromone receptor [Pontibacillus chungwhensis]
MDESVNVEAIISPFQQPEEAPIFAVYKVLSRQYERSQVLECMKHFCLESRNEDNQRKGLEFLYIIGFREACEKLIKINEASSNPINQQWGRVYRIVLERKTHYNDPNEILLELSRIKPLNKEINVIMLFLKLYAHVDLNQYGKMGNDVEAITEEMLHIRDSFLLLCYEERLDEVFFVYHLSKNELLLGRKYAFKVLNKTFNPDKKSFVHNYLAISYVLESYQHAMYHANEAMRIAEEAGDYRYVESVKNHNIPFLSAVNGVYEGITTSDKSEQAHLAVARGDVQTAIDILSPIQDRSPFQDYYLGKALKDKELLTKSHQAFIRQGHYMFAKIPLSELKKL